MTKVEKMTIQSYRKIGKILDIGLNSTSMPQVLRFVRDRVARHEKFYIVTPNPEIILAAGHNKILAEALNSSDLAIPDGIGLAQGATFVSWKSPGNFLFRILVTLLQGLSVGFLTFFNKRILLGRLNIIKGRDIFVSLISLANKKGWRVFFLGGHGDEAERAAERLKINYKKVKIETSAGPQYDNDLNPATEADRKLSYDVVNRINDFQPHLLFVGFGAPKQEIWIYKNLKELNVGGAMVVGGSFRYFSGKSKLPPEWMARFGVEWLWRLIMEPRRAVRIFRAIVVFPWKVFWWKLRI